MTKSVNVFVLSQLLGKVSIHIFFRPLTPTKLAHLKQNTEKKTQSTDPMLKENSRCRHLSWFGLCLLFLLFLADHVKTVSHIFILHVDVTFFNVGTP